jgi:phenylacetate-coenzyme A ligase PaaK-like adenylate-forming protein
MPKIRLAIGDVVKVVQPQCTTTVRGVRLELPVMKVMGRSSEAISLGHCCIFKSEVVEALNQVHKYGRVRWWDLFIESWGIELVVIPAEPVDEQTLIEEVRSALLAQNIDLAQALSIDPVRLQVRVLIPEAYVQVEEEIKLRKKQGMPLGQLKPLQIHQRQIAL